VNVSVKQVIVVRTDLNMRKGKIAAQVAHASLKVFLDRKMSGFNSTINEHLVPRDMGRSHLVIPLTDAMEAWVDGVFAKIVLGVESEADLLHVHEAAKAAGIPTALIQDLGHTEFHGVPTYTTCALGPDLPEKIDTITGPAGLVKTKLL
jgi:PTH2 family peptidyl-tRNA hydrolase